jgi:uncharacterized protein (DUF3084 family)
LINYCTESPFLLNESEIGLGELLFDTRKRVTRLIEKLEKSIPDLKFSADGEERLRTKYLKLTDRVFALEQLAQSSKNKADEIQRHREELEERLIYMERQVERARSKYGKIIEGTPSAAAEEKNVIAQGSDASAGVSADLKVFSKFVRCTFYNSLE